MLQEWVRGDHITFAANPNFWGPAPKAKTVILRWSKEAAQRLLELQSGTADGIDNVAPEDIPTVQKDANLKIYPRDPLTTVYVAMNNKIKPFDNEKVRQAVAVAIDRKRITDQFYAPGSVVAEQFAPPGIKPGNSEGMKWYAYDPAAAKKMLADAGFPNGFDVTLSYRDVVRPYLPSPGKVAQDIQAQLKDVGINVKLQVKESGAFLDSARQGNEPFFLLGWFADFPDATNFFDTHFSLAIKQWGNAYSDIANEISAGATLSDPAERQKHYDKVNELLKQHAPMVPLAYGTSAVAFKANVKGAHSSAFGDESFFVMDNGSSKLVFMQNAEPITLWCGDEEDGETFRACIQMYDPLLNYEIGGTKVIPAIAETYEGNKDATVWTFHLRKGVKFADGTTLNANDVVASYAQQWDVNNPLHKGRQNLWTYFGSLFGACLNGKDGDCAKK
jgi:ABC-type transport system substrate-binding protein